MKVVLLIDIPKTCFDCPCFFDNEGMSFCQATDKLVDAEQGKPSWCPLRPLPQHIWHEEGKESEGEEWFKNGWNACLDEILGDEE